LLGNDLSLAVRGLSRSPGFAAIAIITLTLGIGASTAIFSVVNGVLLRSLPYPDPRLLDGRNRVRKRVQRRRVVSELRGSALVRAPKGGNKPTWMPHGTSLFDLRAALPEPGERQELRGLRVFSVPAALVRCGAALFTDSATEARTALAMVQDASDVLAILLEAGTASSPGGLPGPSEISGVRRSRTAS